MKKLMNYSTNKRYLSEIITKVRSIFIFQTCFKIFISDRYYFFMVLTFPLRFKA